jgi:hypothetical protein
MQDNYSQNPLDWVFQLSYNFIAAENRAITNKGIIANIDFIINNLDFTFKVQGPKRK